MRASDSDSNPSPAPEVDSGAIAKAAADWLALRDQRDFTSEEQVTFERWLKADPRHAHAVTELAAAWKMFDRLEQYPRPADAPPAPDFFARRRRFRRVLPVALAAAAAIAIAIVSWSRWAATTDRAQKPAPAAEANELRSLRLPDSSQVKLNVGSEILEQFTPGERRVQLVRGEAHFAVTKNPQRPFVVRAGAVAVRAVGTAFDVRMRSNAIEVLVTEGRVRVDSDNDTFRADGPDVHRNSSPAEFLFLAAGQRGIIPISPDGEPLAPVVQNLTPSEMQWALAWQAGRFVFDATPLADVITQFNSRNPQHLTLVDPALGALRISGSFRVNDVDSFVQLLELGFHIAVERQANGEIVLRKARSDQQ